MGSISTPTPSPASSNPQFLIIGAGSRGEAYARAVLYSTPGTIVAVAEPDASKRHHFGLQYVWKETGQPQPGQSFDGWEQFLEYETTRRQKTPQDTHAASTDNTSQNGPRIDGIFICTLDATHAPIITALAPLGLHILCEKPLALSLSDCLSIQKTLSAYPPRVFSIGHVLRYSPHNMTLRKLVVEDQAIGEIVSIEHTEPVGWWHFSHSYVRGNWRRAVHEPGESEVGSLLTKSCHDVDFLLWLMCSPSPLTGDKPHEPTLVTSTGALTHFRKSRKPRAAAQAGATNCLNCPSNENDECDYSAVKIYRDRHLRVGKTDWPVKIVCPDIEDIFRTSGLEAAEKRLMGALAEDYNRGDMSDEDIARRSWYGRCVYEADNDVCDDQTVVISWDEDPLQTSPGSSTAISDTATDATTTPAAPVVDDDSATRENSYGRGPKQALFHMTYPTLAQCDRRGRIYGSKGEITYDSHTITHHDFHTQKTTSIPIPTQSAEANKSHGGGDWGLAGAFVRAVVAVESAEMSVEVAQRRFVGCDVEEVLRSHGVVFAAEEARTRRKVVEWKGWWEGKSKSKVI